MVGLIPARSGSKRVRNKNIRRLAGHPCLAYTVAAARDSGIFDDVIVSTDSEEYADIARYYGAEVPFLRPQEMASDLSPDIEWIRYTLERLRDEGRPYDAFSILRPTSPFRLPETIRRGWEIFGCEEGVDSLRAVNRCSEHPGKMWVIRGRRMLPLVPLTPADRPWHSSQYQSLPEVFVQNGSLEFAWSRVVLDGGTIAGEVIIPFLTEDHEGFDVNRPLDWRRAEDLVVSGEAQLPRIDLAPYSK